MEKKKANWQHNKYSANLTLEPPSFTNNTRENVNKTKL